jgi:hypothetical protein
METKQLHIGNVIFIRHFGQITYFGKIDRVTDNFAFSGDRKFRRAISGDRNVVTSPSVSSSAWYFIPTDDEIREYKISEDYRRLSAYNFLDLPHEKILKILEIIKE